MRTCLLLLEAVSRLTKPGLWGWAGRAPQAFLPVPKSWAWALKPLLGGIFLLVGCIEGQKPTPLSRSGTSPEPAASNRQAPLVVRDPSGKEVLPPPTPEPKPSLYQRLGSEAGITQVVHDFVAIVAEDEKIKEKHRKHFMEGDVALLKKKLIDQIGEATGGPQKYTGKNMKDAHKGMEITNQDFDNLAADLVKALERNKVPADAQKELLALLETMRKDIVEKED